MSDTSPLKMGHKLWRAAKAVAAIANDGCRCGALEEYESEPDSYQYSSSPYPCRCDTCECYTLANAAITAFHGPAPGKRRP
jgi:hypothetical protein